MTGSACAFAPRVASVKRYGYREGSLHGTPLPRTISAQVPASRDPVGGATQLRDRFFIRVTVGPRKRLAARAAVGQVAWPRRMLAASSCSRGSIGCVKPAWPSVALKFVKQGARANPATVAKLGARVDSLVKNDGVYRVGHDQRRRPRRARRVTFRAFAERWTSGDLARAYPDHVPGQSVGRRRHRTLGKARLSPGRRRTCSRRSRESTPTTS